jgi:hypothetical protein
VIPRADDQTVLGATVDEVVDGSLQEHVVPAAYVQHWHLDARLVTRDISGGQIKCRQPQPRNQRVRLRDCPSRQLVVRRSGQPIGRSDEFAKCALRRAGVISVPTHEHVESRKHTPGPIEAQFTRAPSSGEPVSRAKSDGGGDCS